MDDIDKNILKSTLDPLCYSQVLIYIKDLLSASNVNDNIYQLMSRYISKVKIFGFVVKLQYRHDSIDCFIDDGTAEVRCFLKNTIDLDAISQCSAAVNSNLVSRYQHTSSIELGSFIILSGIIKTDRCSKNYVSSSQWEKCDEFKFQSLWHTLVKRRINLYKEVYTKSINLETLVDKAKVSIVLQKLYHMSLEKFKSVFNELIKKTNFTEFYGYELFDTSEIKQAVSECKQKLMSDFKHPKENKVFSSALCCVLFWNSCEGFLIRDRSKISSKVTKHDQLNSRYFVTLNYKPLKQFLSTYLSEHENYPSIKKLELILSKKFTFFVNNKHSSSALFLLYNQTNKFRK